MDNLSIRILTRLNNTSLERLKKGYVKKEQYENAEIVDSYQRHVEIISRMIKIE